MQSGILEWAERWRASRLECQLNGLRLRFS
jgi:hypothetical protein